MIYGSVYFRTPAFHNWAYNAERGVDCLKIWDLIPDDTDIVVTHGPPLGKADCRETGVKVSASAA